MCYLREKRPYFLRLLEICQLKVVVCPDWVMRGLAQREHDSGILPLLFDDNDVDVSWDCSLRLCCLPMGRLLLKDSSLPFLIDHQLQ